MSNLQQQVWKFSYRSGKASKFDFILCHEKINKGSNHNSKSETTYVQEWRHIQVNTFSKRVLCEFARLISDYYCGLFNDAVSIYTI
jgi:hypothetical protein